VTRPRLLDLFCGAGGCSVGYQRAGFDVHGVDIRVQHRYPLWSVEQANALDVLADVEFCRSFDVLAASPPCKQYTSLNQVNKRRHPDLLTPTRAALKAIGRPYIIENVVGAPLVDPGVAVRVDVRSRVRRPDAEAAPAVRVGHAADCAY
jgi:DNA (cytosine-5)-methyltransferase 1